MLDIIKIKQSSAEVDQKRQAIVEMLARQSAGMKSPVLTSISTEDLQLLFQFYDEAFFQNWFRDHFKGHMKFSLSRKMTKSAGKTLCPKNIGAMKPEDVVLEIRIGVDFFLYYGQLTKNHTVCGLKTGSSREALMLVFEHELCHVIEFLLFYKSSCKCSRFKSMANHLFGHLDSYHKLPTNRQIAGKVFGLKIGDTVSFEYKKTSMTGLLYKINKRAVVLVTDRNGTLMDKRGIRYSRYYVPLTLLRASVKG